MRRASSKAHAFALAAACIVAGLALQPAPSAGQSPGSGYTADFYWNCGLLYGGFSQSCYEDSTASNPCLGRSCAHNHTYGWGQASYTGSGSTTVLVHGSCHTSGACANIPAFSNQGTNVARVCQQWGCNDQDDYLYKMFVAQDDTSGARHTIYGHGKA